MQGNRGAMGKKASKCFLVNQVLHVFDLKNAIANPKNHAQPKPRDKKFHAPEHCFNPQPLKT